VARNDTGIGAACAKRLVAGTKAASRPESVFKEKETEFVPAETRKERMLGSPAFSLAAPCALDSRARGFQPARRVRHMARSHRRHLNDSGQRKKHGTIAIGGAPRARPSKCPLQAPSSTLTNAQTVSSATSPRRSPRRLHSRRRRPDCVVAVAWRRCKVSRPRCRREGSAICSAQARSCARLGPRAASGWSRWGVRRRCSCPSPAGVGDESCARPRRRARCDEIRAP